MCKIKEKKKIGEEGKRRVLKQVRHMNICEIALSKRESTHMDILVFLKKNLGNIMIRAKINLMPNYWQVDRIAKFW